LDETGHFYFAQTGHSHFAATGQRKVLTIALLFGYKGGLSGWGQTDEYPLPEIPFAPKRLRKLYIYPEAVR
jgi:hypothetical protein